MSDHEPETYDLDACPWCEREVRLWNAGDPDAWDPRTCPHCRGVYMADARWQEGMDEEDIVIVGIEPPPRD